MCLVVLCVEKTFLVVNTNVSVSVTDVIAWLKGRPANNHALKREHFVITCVLPPATLVNLVLLLNAKQW